VEHDWDNILSLHEQAALVVARALLAKPQFVFLDRMSVAMDATEAGEVLNLFTQRSIGYLVLGEPDDDLGHFDAALTIERDGSWNWRKVVD
jgi:putative ATP-binding cassette transporter